MCMGSTVGQIGHVLYSQIGEIGAAMVLWGRTRRMESTKTFYALCVPILAKTLEKENRGYSPVEIKN